MITKFLNVRLGSVLHPAFRLFSTTPIVFAKVKSFKEESGLREEAKSPQSQFTKLDTKEIGRHIFKKKDIKEFLEKLEDVRTSVYRPEKVEQVLENIDQHVEKIEYNDFYVLLQKIADLPQLQIN